MAVNFEKSQTVKNLAKAFAAEAQDGARYQFMADTATQEQLSYLSTILKGMATNEMAHAKVFFDYIDSKSGHVVQSIEFKADYPYQCGALCDMLQFEEQNERHQAVNVYPEFSRIAKEEGFADIAETFIRVAQVETCHTNTFAQLHKMYKEKTLYKSSQPKKFKCTNCGHEAVLKEAWKTCPLCGKPQGYAKIDISEEPKDKVIDASESFKARERKIIQAKQMQKPKVKKN